MSAVKQLYRLQLVDSEWAEKTNRLAEAEAGLGESGDLIRAREAVVEIEGHLAELKSQLRALELEIGGVNDKLKKNQEQLYGGRIRNPKELKGLQEEATALRRRRSELEDAQLEIMIAIEEEEAEMAERQARLRQIEGTWREEQATLLHEKQQLEQELAELEEQRGAMRTRLGAADLTLYDDLRRQSGGVAVVLLKQGICQACGVDVPISAARAVERGEGMHYCPVCNRLLYGG
jgi:predicted  nucleic acid-binding Zn-ribbon protein